ncbi:MAG TPA: MBL fold metallo-hydrolase [Acetobacteraceae bacterium]|nr:MBL fold metallo-hydrolase [Acetobacteraceae bacterium]
MPDITYEVLALRYGIFDGRLQFQNYIIPDDHAAPDPLDFYVFAVRGNGRTIVMDTGFNPVSAKRRGRELLRTPAEALLQAGIDPAEVPDVVLTHMHWVAEDGVAGKLPAIT